MAKKENTILAIDVGGNSLKMAEFLLSATGGMILTGYAIEEYGDEYAQGEFLDGFAVTYRRMLAQNQFSSKQARITISGQAAFSRLSKLPPLAGQREQLAKIIEFEARQTVPYPMDEVAWAYQLIKHSSSEAGGSTGLELEDVGSSDELEALYVAVKADLLSRVTDVIQDSGRDIVSIEIAATAVFNAAKANRIGDSECNMILDIGGRSSSLIFLEQGRIFVRPIPIAGDAITQQIAKEFNIGFGDAEELKRRHGFIALGGAYEDPDSETAATISKIARNVMTRLHGEVSRSINLWRSQHGGGRPEKLYLCGGSSIIPYSPHFFCEKLRVPVEYLNVFPVAQIDPSIDKEALGNVAQVFAPLIGLGLRSIANCPVQISLMSKSIKQDEALRRRKPYFYASAATAVICMCLLLFGIQQRTKYDQRLYEESLGAFNATKAMSDKVQSVKSRVDGYSSGFDSAIDLLALRDDWTKVIMELQRVLPPTTWLTYVEAVPAAGTQVTGGFAPVAPMVPVAPGMGGMVEISQMNLLPVMIPQLENIEWLLIEGHSLVLDSGVPPENVLQQNLDKSEIFAGGTDAESFQYEYMYSADGKMNITSFRIRLRLAEPIQQSF